VIEEGEIVFVGFIKGVSTKKVGKVIYFYKMFAEKGS